VQDSGCVSVVTKSHRKDERTALRPSEGLSTVSARDPVEVRTQLGRNLTYGMLDALGRSIVIGTYDKHPFPTEAELAKQHGVSRSVTREAVKMLTAKGLLSARPRQGTIVQPSGSWNLFDTDVLRWLLERKFSVDLLRHFNQLRVAIEPEAAALAAVYAGPNERDAITAGLERMEAAENGLDNTLDADIAFHVAILKASGNPFYAQFQDVVATALRSSIQFTNRIKGRSANVADHAAVRDAIVKRRAETARAAMRKIIADVLDLIDNVQDKAPPKVRKK
jgi:DNA-binding FadR family transcriptional regulator